MAGVILYIVTLILESISVAVRYLLVSALVGLFAGESAGMLAGGIAAAAPLLVSLAVLAGAPSGHVLARRSLRAREPTPDERGQLEATLRHFQARGVPVPQRFFMVDDEGLNAAIAGRTLFVYKELLDSPYLPGVIAHELGHFNHLESRLLMAIRALTVPGGFFIAYLLLGALRWVAYVLATALTGLLFLIFVVLGMRLGAVTSMIFNTSLLILRMLIIFAVGGVGPALLGTFWRGYMIEREYAADAYAARLGYADDLIRFFEHEILDDIRIPWYTQPTHPSATRRVEMLRRQIAQPDPPRRRPVRPTPAAAPPAALAFVQAPLGRLRPLPLLVGAAAIALLLAAALLLAGPGGAEPPAGPPPPTPTLGL